MNQCPQVPQSTPFSAAGPKSDGKFVRLGDVCRVVGGSTPKSGVSEYWGGDIVWVTPADLGRLHETYVADCERRITRSGYESCGTQLVPAGAVILSSRAPIGHLAIAAQALCTNQGCKSFVPGPRLDSSFLYFVLKHSVSSLRALGSGATFAEVSKSQLEDFRLPLPPLPEQRRIAALLTDELAAVDRARAAAEAQLSLANELAHTYLRATFDKPSVLRWSRRQLGDLCDLLPARSIMLAGDAEVLAITTACLTETGFNPSGVKVARMRAQDAAECVVSSGEVLVARSNTADLVGRAAMYAGSPQGVVASDLTIRLQPREGLCSAFLAAYLSSLYVAGHWKERAGGASGSMKKITRTQLAALEIPTPLVAEQRRIGSALGDQLSGAKRTQDVLEKQFAAINQLPAALLRQAFSGEL